MYKLVVLFALIQLAVSAPVIGVPTVYHQPAIIHPHAAFIQPSHTIIQPSHTIIQPSHAYIQPHTLIHPIVPLIRTGISSHSTSVIHGGPAVVHNVASPIIAV